MTAAPAPPAAVSTAVTVTPPAAGLQLDVSGAAEYAGAGLVILGFLALIQKWLTKDIVRDIGEIRHKLGNVATKVDSLEHLRIADVERIVKLEASFTSVEKSIDRIERTLIGRFDELSESIREIRVVAPK